MSTIDFKEEMFAHLQILVADKARNVATPTSNQYLRAMLQKHGSCKEILHAKQPFFDAKNLEKLKTAEKQIEKFPENIKILTILDENYPKQLQYNNQTTPMLYYKGNQNILHNKSIAVVGTRSPLTEQEKIDAHKVLEDLIAKEYTIVSGLALGCDTLGHTYGLRTNTIAVLGTPLNKRYPKENKDLQDKIAQDHIVVSQYPIGIENFLYYKTEQPQNFSKRNQTTVALASQGVLVLKTGDKGGTQHAIKEARIQNKKLYTMRCNFNPDNTWTNNFTWKQYGIVYEAE